MKGIYNYHTLVPSFGLITKGVLGGSGEGGPLKILTKRTILGTAKEPQNCTGVIAKSCYSCFDYVTRMNWAASLMYM